eukprot:CAMPEP_0182855906 /NCGR_PEP_ID=MMETSP0034_2-20130328/2125_1 /TAXON_ID=156128 /ORGANISM="Nephroselmis pyriformis, Strain CCMP717" /LENGTH=566 /DNA_ID=CAMNT_0024986937 /DNA_START=112 /DNA_END=1812 /DNA_ORIENTATION=+
MGKNKGDEAKGGKGKGKGKGAPPEEPPAKPSSSRAGRRRGGNAPKEEIDEEIAQLLKARPKPKPAAAPLPKEGIHTLPPHVLEEVFNFLPTRDKAAATSVCKAFRDAGEATCVNLRVLNVSEIPLDPFAVRYMARRCSLLVRVDLEWCRALSDHELELLAAGCQGIEHLCLAGCKRITDAGVGALCRASPRLRHLDLAGCHLLTGATLAATHESNSLLEVLQMDGCKRCRVTAAVQAEGSLLELRDLSLSGADLAGVLGVELYGRYPKLAALRLGGCAALGSDFLLGLGAVCQELTELDISGCGEVDALLLFQVLEELPQLARLAVGGCEQFTDQACEIVLAKCPLLTSISVPQCSKLSGHGLVRIIAARGGELKEIDVSGCGNIGEESMIHVAQSCPNLEVIKANGMDTLSEGWLITIGFTCGHGLLHIDLNDCVNVTDIGIGHFLNGCQSLKSLHISGCGRLTTVGLRSIGLLCPKLESLNLGGIPSVTDSGLVEIVSGCPELRALDISKCWKITDDAIIEVAMCCRHLRVLRMLGCEGVRGVGPRRVQRLCKGLVELAVGAAT